MSAMTLVTDEPLRGRSAKRRLLRRVRRLSGEARAALRLAAASFAPPQRMTHGEWAEEFRYMHSGPLKGSKFMLDAQPALRGILAACDDPLVREIWCQKSAQLGWTQGITLNVMFRRVHLDPCEILILFSREGIAERYMLEKVEPAVRANEVLRERISLEARNKDNTKERKAFPGGFIQTVSTRSAGNMKSSEFPLVIVEEPDDTAKNVQDQGDSIALARERYKSFYDGRMLVGGTPTVKGLSKIAAGVERTDMRRMYVQCPHCGHEQTLRFEQLRWANDSPVHHPIYGTARPETAAYACEACGVDDAPETYWTDDQKNQALLVASRRPDHGWKATGQFNGLAGFYVSDLYSVFPGARFRLLVEKLLEAEDAMKRGDDTLMRSFWNNQRGEPFEIRSDGPEIAELSQRGEDYAPWVAPAPVSVVTCFVDVQRGGEKSGAARLEFLLVGWGREEESWRIARDVVLGNPLEQATWDALDAKLARPILSAAGGQLHIDAMGVDAGDGMTMEAVLAYVRAKRRQGREVIATKGSSKRDKPLFSQPTKRDTTYNDKAAKYGLKLYHIGVSAGKSTLAGRLKLCDRAGVTGRGRYRMHWPASIGETYFEQITAEVLIPGPSGDLVWEKLAGRANEMLDCEIGNLHLAAKLRLYSQPEGWWRAREERIRQPDLLSAAQPALVIDIDDPAGDDDAAMSAPMPVAVPATPQLTRPAVQRVTGFR